MTTTLFTEFPKLLQEIGLFPPPTDRDPWGTVADQQIQMALEKVKDFPVDQLHKIRAYATNPEYPVRNWQKLVQEMQRLLAQSVQDVPEQKGQDISDEFIDRYLRRQWEERYEHVDREMLPLPALPLYDSLKARYGKKVMA